jgi:hypothetical protein
MVAFICPCGNTKSGLPESWVPSEKDGHSYVVCSQECYEKFHAIYLRGYQDGYNDGREDSENMREAKRESKLG